MDLRVLVLASDAGLADLLRAQVENLGCPCTVATSYKEATSTFGWADAAVVDVAGEGIDDLNRLRVEAPLLRVLAVSPDDDLAAQAQSAGAHQVLVEPFAISDVVTAVRMLGPRHGDDVVDLRPGQTPATADDAPWWATR